MLLPTAFQFKDEIPALGAKVAEPAAIPAPSATEAFERGDWGRQGREATAAVGAQGNPRGLAEMMQAQMEAVIWGGPCTRRGVLRFDGMLPFKGTLPSPRYASQAEVTQMSAQQAERSALSTILTKARIGRKESK